MPTAITDATLESFRRHKAARDAVSGEPCRCHADLFAPPTTNGADPDFDAAIEQSIASGRKSDDARRLEDINETLGLLTMASKPEDVNHVLMLTLIGKLREQVNKAR